MGAMLRIIDAILTDNSPAARWLREHCREELWHATWGSEVKVWIWDGSVSDDPDEYLALVVGDGYVEAVNGDGTVRMASARFSTNYKRNDGLREAIAWMRGFLTARGIQN